MGPRLTSSHVAFLRGMNLGGRRISNAELVAEFEALGLDSVVAFRASGNVIFESSASAESELIAKIEAGLGKGLGYSVPTFVRSGAAVEEVAGFEPFDSAQVGASAGRLQVTLLGKAPSASARKRALALATDEDLLAIEGRELYWLPSGGTLDSELDVEEVGRLLGQGTTRTKGTIEGIAAKLPGRGE